MLRILAVVLLSLAALAGCADAPATPPAAPAPDQAAVDSAFVAGMVPHHEQALELTAMVPGRGGSPGLEAIALRIDRDQAEEIGQLQGLALARRLPPVPMAHAMAGMADPAALATVRSLHGPAFERLWLDTMVRHHEGALAMARDYLAAGTDDTLRRYCEALLVAQGQEIATMRALATATGP